MTINELAQERDLVFFDLETTGLNVVTDRIVQFAAIKYPAGSGQAEERSQLINPGCAIPAEVTAIHGITDADVRQSPTFADYADELYDWIGDADLAGYNLGRFDIPLLMEEFGRVGLAFRIEQRRVIDVQEIFYKMEPRTLAGAFKYYCGEELEGAHDALIDVRATTAVLQGQLKMYNAIEPSVEALHAFTRRPGQLDSTNRLRLDDKEEVVFNFGKYKGQRCKDVFRKEKSYYHWLQDRDFSIQVKEITRQVWESL